jgi:uncharacterized protein
MSVRLTRRNFTGLLPVGLLLPLAGQLQAAPGKNFRIRTLTAGFQAGNGKWLKNATEATKFLRMAAGKFTAMGYEVQTLRLASQPLPQYMPNWSSDKSVQAIREMDKFATEQQIMLSLGPVILGNSYQPEFAPWALEVIQSTDNTSFSANMASPGEGVHHQAIRSASEAILAIAHGSPGGTGNFRFAANAFTPSGTPFFPAAYFDRGRAFSIGLESPNLLSAAFRKASDLSDGARKLVQALNGALRPVENLAREISGEAQWQYLGIDTSPAPGLEASIGGAIENLTLAPFGSSSTLSACAVITDALKKLEIQQCGYSGLMLPIMEDTVLAKRAAQKRFGISELLLYSSVCGTGLDVVPIPGAVTPGEVAKLLADVASLATKYQKPLSARLFPAPGLQAGDMVRFDNPYLTDAAVMSLP